MRSKLLVPGLVAMVLAIAACGSNSSTKTSSASTSTSTSATTTVARHVKRRHVLPSRTYHLLMRGKNETPPGAPKGTAHAVIALHANKDEICWRFSHLKGFTDPTFAHIHRGPKGTAGPIVVPLSVGRHFLAKGCVKVSAARIKTIERNPRGYYVNIHSKKYPAGAVRSQL